MPKKSFLYELAWKHLACVEIRSEGYVFLLPSLQQLGNVSQKPIIINQD